MRERQVGNGLEKINYRGEAAQVIRFLRKGGMRYLAIVQTNKKPLSFHESLEEIAEIFEEVHHIIGLELPAAVEAVAERMGVNGMTAVEYISMQKNKSE